jgi:hypothetical protein
MALIGNIRTTRNGHLVLGLSGDSNMDAEYARKLSLDEAAKGCVVTWACTNGDTRDVRRYVEGVEQDKAAT